MPLPYPSLLQSGAARARCPNRLGSKSLNWLYLGQPRTCSRDLALHVGAGLSALQWNAVGALEKNVIAWNAAGTFGPKEMARAASKFAGLEDLLQACQLEWSSLAPSADRSDARLHFEAARYALPVEPNFPDHPSFDPAPYLDTANRRVYGTLGP